MVSDTRTRRRQPQPHQCPVCFDPVEEERCPVFHCSRCTDYCCLKCIANMLEVCENGCPCASYKCPTCRAEVCMLIPSIQNAELLHGVIAKMREILQEENSTVNIRVSDEMSI